jgi:hypothetical protein
MRLCLGRAAFVRHNLSATKFVRLLPSCFTLFLNLPGRLFALFFGLLPCGFSCFLFSSGSFQPLLLFDLSAL